MSKNKYFAEGRTVSKKEVEENMTVFAQAATAGVEPVVTYDEKTRVYTYDFRGIGTAEIYATSEILPYYYGGNLTNPSTSSDARDHVYYITMPTYGVDIITHDGYIIGIGATKEKEKSLSNSKLWDIGHVISWYNGNDTVGNGLTIAQTTYGVAEGIKNAGNGEYGTHKVDESQYVNIVSQFIRNIPGVPSGTDDAVKLGGDLIDKSKEQYFLMQYNPDLKGSPTYKSIDQKVEFYSIGTDTEKNPRYDVWAENHNSEYTDIPWTREDDDKGLYISEQDLKDSFVDPVFDYYWDTIPDWQKVAILSFFGGAGVFVDSDTIIVLYKTHVFNPFLRDEWTLKYYDHNNEIWNKEHENPDTDTTAVNPNIRLSKIRALKPAYDNAKAAVMPVDPLMLDLDGNGLDISKKADGAHFDLDSNGFAERMNCSITEICPRIRSEIYFCV